MDLSIIIPAYNEVDKIVADIQSASEFLAVENLPGQIIVVDDGSIDNTAQTAQKSETQAELKVISLPAHHGKGHAVKQGVLQTTADYVMFIDSGNCVPLECANAGLDLLRTNQCDLAHGTRYSAASKIQTAQPLTRRILGFLFRKFTTILLKLPQELTDTQCGFKIYKGPIARELYNECFTEGFMFDLEIILRARRKNYRIKEFPLTWSCDPDSRLKPARKLTEIISELIKIRRKI